MNWGSLLFFLLGSLCLTVGVYLLVPIILILQKKKYTKAQIKKITIINSIVCCIFFMVLKIIINGEARPSAAVFLWGGVGYALLKKYCWKEFDFIQSEEADIEVPTAEEHPSETKQPVIHEVCLSDPNAEQKTYGNYNVKASDLKLSKDPGDTYVPREAVLPRSASQTDANTAPNETFTPPQQKSPYTLIAAILFFLTAVLVVIAVIIYRIPSADSSSEFPAPNSEGTSAMFQHEITWLDKYHFQYYEDEARYVLLFELSDEKEEAVSAVGSVDIRIVNDAGITVYEEKRKFTKGNFEHWNYDAEEEYVAAIYIDTEDIKQGSTADGTLYFTVYGEDFSFEETSLIVVDLPKKASTPAKPKQSSSSDVQTKPQEDTPISTPQEPPVQQEVPPVELPSQDVELPQQPEQEAKITCLEYSCKNVVNKNGEYCSEHKCTTPTCSSKKGFNSEYCTTCVCLSIGCKDAKQENGHYCKEHTCEASGCTSEKSYGKDYCFQHTCNNCDNLCVSGFYCDECACVERGCTSAKGINSEYCNLHQCMAGVCKKGQINGGYYCKEHTCIKSGCNDQKLYDSEYCYFHTP